MAKTEIRRLAVSLLVLLFLTAVSTSGASAEEPVEHGFADSGGVKIHYVTAGQGPLVVMIHGFPDYWYTWREQIPQLSKHFQVVAIDQRGYNKSDQPEGVENYSMDKLAGDVRAVVQHFDRDRAIIVGHDWGGSVAWTFAMMYPDITERLVVLNLPHPAGLSRELASNPAQQEASGYVRHFQTPGAWKSLNANSLAFWVKDEDARKKYVEAFERSSFEGMLNYYLANFPRPPYQETKRTFPKIKCPVLLIHGLEDRALLPGGLNDTWDHLDNELTLVTIPGASHFVQQDASEKVTRTINHWLRQDELN